MGATADQVEERGKNNESIRVDMKDVEKGEVGMNDSNEAMLHRLNPTNPLRIVLNANTRVASPSPHVAPSYHSSSNDYNTNTTTTTTRNVSSSPAPSYQSPQPPSQPTTQPRSTPSTRVSVTSLNSRTYTNKISLFLFVLHLVGVVGLVGFLVFKGIQGLILASESVQKKEKEVLRFLLPQVEAASLLSITLAIVWQKAVRLWPAIMVHFILWSTFVMSLSAGILLICFQKPATDGIGVCFILFAVGNGLYACWVTQRTKFSSEILMKSLDTVSKFPDLNHPTYWMLLAGFMWMSLWILAVLGALNFYFPALIITAMVFSLAWTTEVMRNVVNLTVSRVIALYYLRGMQSNTQFCFQRALTHNLGSACLGSFFVPTIEALRIVARALNLLEGEDEFMFSCAHCCLKVMHSIFKYGNGWAFVQIAAYGKGFVRASQDTWDLFEAQEIEPIIDSDITSSLCFLTGVCSGSICVIMAAAWTATVHQSFLPTISLLTFFIGYLMTRIAMAVPHACVSCYYVCYAENPENRMFDKTIKDQLALMKSGRDVVVPTPRVPRRFA